MTAGRPDPYETLGVGRTASEDELHAAYRRLVQLHHPDHNGGSVEAARRFEEVQEAYAQVRRMRASSGSSRLRDRQPGGAGRSRDPASRPSGATQPPPGAMRPEDPPPAADPRAEARLAEMERELEQARQAREKAMRAAQRAARRGKPDSPSDEELGYVTTEDSFTKIFDDVAAKLSERLSEAEKGARADPRAKRISDLIDELGSKLTGDPPDRS